MTIVTRAVVSRLISYPVKGCAGVRLTDAVLEPTGLPHDRSFMVVDSEGVFRSQRRDRRLAVIKPEVSPDGKHLVLRAPGAAEECLEIDVNSARRGVRLFREHYQGIDQGDRVAAWLSDVLGAPSRLVRVPPEHDRIARGRVPGPSHYADSNAVHLISQASLDALNERLAGRGEPPVPMARFRPNIVVSGWEEPHLEDRVRWLSIGRAELAYAKIGIRCAVPLIDQRTGTKAGPEPLRTLATYRRATGGGLAFGIKLSVVTPGSLATGDSVHVSSWGDSEFLPSHRPRGEKRQTGQRMRTMSATIWIDAAPGAVWAILTDLGRYPEWNPLFREASGQVAVGNTIMLRSVHPANGRMMTVRPKITVADPDAELRWVSSLPGIISGEHRFALAPADGGTRLEQSETFRGLLAAFPGKTFTRADASFRALNEALKKRAEGS